MDGGGKAFGIVLSLCCLVVGGCHSSQDPGNSATAEQTIDAIAQRISNRMSLRKLNHLATHGDALLGVLTRQERDRLGRGYLTLSLKVPMTVYVAAPSMTVPFWIRDQGFKATNFKLSNVDSDWALFRKDVPAGSLGLGVNALDRAPKTHYVVFLKPIDSEEKVDGLLELNEANSSDWKLTRAEHNQSPTFDVFHPFATIPTELQGSFLLQAKHERRHATLLAPARIWKTHVPSGPLPDQVTIAFGGDPAHEIVWSWRTQPEIEGSKIRLVMEEPGQKTAGEMLSPTTAPKIVTGESTLVATPCVLNDRAIRRHRVEARGLQADRSYLYSLGDGSPNGWGPWAKVRTAPHRSKAIQFLYLGDPQTGFETWGPRLETAYRQNPDARFALIAGDLVDRGNERTNWDHFFLRSAGVFDRLPLMPCAGNHEYLDQGPQLFKMFFDLPRNGPKSSEPDLVYSFEYGDAFFAILDSTMGVSSNQSAEEQAAWLDRSLSESKATWKFVMYHHPVYASRRVRDNLPLQKHWVPIIDKHHVDIVFQGHDHTYMRTHPLRAGERVATADTGTFYVVSVSGDEFYEQESLPELDVGRSYVPTAHVIDLLPDARRLTYRSVAESGETIDSFVIEKPARATTLVRTDGK